MLAMKVVVIEDKPLIRRAIVETLDWPSMDCELVASAGDGIEGKRVIEQHEPDIIITDIRMPDMDGLQLAEYALERLASCKVIVITGYQDFQYAKQCVRLGVQEYILKPLNNDEMMAAVTKATNALRQERLAVQEKEQLIASARRQYISDILTGEADLSRLYESAGAAHTLSLLQHTYVLFVIREEVGTESSESWLGQLDESLLLMKLEEEEEVYRYPMLNEVAYVCMYHSSAADEVIAGSVHRREHALKRALLEFGEGRCRYECSYPLHRLEQLRERYVEVSSRLRLRDRNWAAYGPLVKGVLQYIDEHFEEDIGLHAVADRFHISTGHLSRLLRKETGSSFVDIVTRTRIREAKRLMRDPTRRISEISELTGFKNYIYFYQVFKKYERQSPQEYRSKL
ncbi:response regulator [Paenibacillus sp. J5C_2022]|uniref:response regulator n=1 Tax=Paenibacillus sp. J5C2022 TaxID=2977129 RepID=UPI0021D09588|nr:response regulator [Paenibacillus sp. J5C2022]MCU6707845.1 response regulator [Paenibacillus sp. J5C2022]